MEVYYKLLQVKTFKCQFKSLCVTNKKTSNEQVNFFECGTEKLAA